MLNLYGHDPVTLVPLSARVWAVFDADPATSPEPDVPLVDAAGEDLITGLVEGFGVRALIQRAIGVVMATERCTAQDAYLCLRVTLGARPALRKLPPPQRRLRAQGAP